MVSKQKKTMPDLSWILEQEQYLDLITASALTVQVRIVLL